MSKTLLAIDIGSINITAVIAKNDLDNKINILGTGVEPSEGINKGLITNIEVASKSIKNAVSNAKRSTPENIDQTVVSISGTYTKGVRSAGSVNVPNGLITEHEINQVMQMALYNATIVPEYEVIHVIPLFFKVDESNHIENPLNMNGARLEVSVYIVTAKKTALINIQSALKASNLQVSNFVLNSYASAISVLDTQQKRFGSIVINIGGTTTDFVCYKGSSILYNDFIPVGSNHITNDLSVMLHTPPSAAEMLKIKYGSLISIDSDELEIKKVKIPRIGDEQNTTEVAISDVQTIIHARVEEVLVLVRNTIRKSGIQDRTGAGIVITGGMSNLTGIKELSSKVFDEMPVKVSNPLNIKNGYINFDDPTMSTIVGLLLYSLDLTNRTFELDSRKELRRKVKPEEPRRQEAPVKVKEHKDVQRVQRDEQIVVKEEEELLPRISKTDKGKGVSKFWNKVSEWF